MGFGKIKWDDCYSVGIEKLDNHHKKLIDIINEMDTILREEEYNKRFQELIVELYKYTDFHFSEEEKMMETYKYPDIYNHKEMHKWFIKKIKEVESNENIHMQGIEAISFLYEWLLNHILNEDKKYVPYFIA